MYNSAIVTSYLRRADARIQLNVEYRGDAGEEMVSEPIYVTAANFDAEIVRREAMQKIARLNAGEQVIDIVEANLPYTVDVTTPLPAPAPTFGQYMAAAMPFSPGASAQDVFTITNAGQKRISLLGTGLATVQGTAGSNTWNLLARTTLNSGGTSSPITAVPTGAGFPAATAEVRAYTANPTAGTLAGRLWAGRVPAPVVGTSGIGNANIDLSAVVNRIVIPPGVTLAFNLNGTTPTGLSVMAWFAWSEN